MSIRVTCPYPDCEAENYVSVLCDEEIAVCSKCGREFDVEVEVTASIPPHVAESGVPTHWLIDAKEKTDALQSHLSSKVRDADFYKRLADLARSERQIRDQIHNRMHAPEEIYP